MQGSSSLSEYVHVTYLWLSTPYLWMYYSMAERPNYCWITTPCVTIPGYSQTVRKNKELIKLTAGRDAREAELCPLHRSRNLQYGWGSWSKLLSGVYIHRSGRMLPAVHPKIILPPPAILYSSSSQNFFVFIFVTFWKYFTPSLQSFFDLSSFFLLLHIYISFSCYPFRIFTRNDNCWKRGRVWMYILLQTWKLNNLGCK